MANRSKNRRRAALYAASTARRRRRPAMQLRAGPPRSRPADRRHRYRLELGSARGLRGAYPQPDPDLQREGARAASAARCSRPGCCAADAVDKALAALRPLPRALRPHGGRRSSGRSRPPPAATRRTASLHQRGGAHLPHQDRRAVRQARGGIVGARRHLRLSPAGRHRRRPRRRLARADRCAWRTHQGRRDASARRAGACRIVSAKSVKKAEKIVKKALDGRAPAAAGGRAARFYAIGGTWRALARLHMWQTGYPLHVMHGYVFPAKEALEFSSLVHRVDPETLSQIEVVTDARRPLLAYAALVLENLVRDRASERGRDLRARRARGAALFDARRQGAPARIRSSLRRAISTCCARARRAWRGIDRLDRPLHGLIGTRRDRRRAAAAACRVPARRYRLARASRLSRRAVAQHYRQCRLRRDRSSRPHFRGARGVLSPCRAGRRGAVHLGCASLPRRACSTAPACSARRCGWLIWCPLRCQACCRRHRWRSSAGGWCCASTRVRRRLPASAFSTACGSLPALLDGSR